MQTDEKEVAEKSFVMQSKEHKTIFRVSELGNGIHPEAVRKILERLPISFSIRKIKSERFDYVNEPLVVHAYAQVISIYPPKDRMIACTHMAWSETNALTRQMNVDNVMDAENPGNGQLRTCVHFDPKIFGVTQWANKLTHEIEVDIHVYPEEQGNEKAIEPPIFNKWKVRALLELIAEGEKTLTEHQLGKWRDLIMYAVKSMRHSYENPNVAEDYPVRLYYKRCWDMIDAAGGNNAKLIAALEYLRISIQHE